MKKCLFVYPSNLKISILPYGMLLLIDTFRKNNIDVFVLDMTEYIYIEDMIYIFDKTIKQYKPDIICFSSTENLFLIVEQLLNNVDINHIPCIIGGPIATYAPQLCFQKCPQISYVAVGEGINTVIKISKKLNDNNINFKNIQGLWYKENNQIIDMGLGVLDTTQDIPKIYLNDFSSILYNDSIYKNIIPIEVNRGCYYNCSFCNIPQITKQYGKNFYRKKNIDLIMKEIYDAKNKYNANAIYFWCDDFLFFSEQDLEKFVYEYKKIQLPFWCQLRIDNISEKKLKLLKEINIQHISIGIEHGSETFRKKILNKNINNIDIINNCILLKKYNINFTTNNIIGFPYETRELVFETIELNKQIKPSSVCCFTFSPYHGTKLRDVCIQNNFIKEYDIPNSFSDYSILDMPNFSKEEIKTIQKCFLLYIKLDKRLWKYIKQAEKNDELLNKLYNIV